MAHDLEFTTSAADDLEKKQGELSHLRAYGFTFRGVAYRVAYELDEARQLVTIVAIGVHDVAYRRAQGR